jgi:hypothetical protein
MVRQTPTSCLDNLAVRRTLLLYSFGRVGGGGDRAVRWPLLHYDSSIGR